MKINEVNKKVLNLRMVQHLVLLITECRRRSFVLVRSPTTTVLKCLTTKRHCCSTDLDFPRDDTALSRVGGPGRRGEISI